MNIQFSQHNSLKRLSFPINPLNHLGTLDHIRQGLLLFIMPSWGSSEGRGRFDLGLWVQRSGVKEVKAKKQQKGLRNNWLKSNSDWRKEEPRNRRWKSKGHRSKKMRELQVWERHPAQHWNVTVHAMTSIQGCSAPMDGNLTQTILSPNVSAIHTASRAELYM